MNRFTEFNEDELTLMHALLTRQRYTTEQVIRCEERNGDKRKPVVKELLAHYKGELVSINHMVAQIEEAMPDVAAAKIVIELPAESV